MLDWAFTLSSSRKALRIMADSLEMIALSSAAVLAARTWRIKSRVVFFTNGILILFIDEGDCLILILSGSYKMGSVESGEGDKGKNEGIGATSFSQFVVFYALCMRFSEKVHTNGIQRTTNGDRMLPPPFSMLSSPLSMRKRKARKQIASSVSARCDTIQLFWSMLPRATLFL